jgi:hypothetical protein
MSYDVLVEGRGLLGMPFFSWRGRRKRISKQMQITEAELMQVLTTRLKHEAKRR